MTNDSCNPSTEATIDRYVNDLVVAKHRLRDLAMAERLDLITACLRGTRVTANEWVTRACCAKGIDPAGPIAGEEIAAGPMAVVRFLRLLLCGLAETERHGAPVLPGRPSRLPDGRWALPVFPTRAGMFDALLFRGFHAHVRTLSDAPLEELLERRAASCRARLEHSAICLVLGAGNVTSIAPTDALSKLFIEGRVVLLKMNPVNDYLGPLLERAFAALIEAGLLRIIYGGADVGRYAVAHPQVDEVHITGSALSHDAIVWGTPLEERDRHKANGTPQLAKPISSELGNVTPWIVLPAEYTSKQLQFQAENVAAMIVNNASFNCIATKMIVTWASWPQRGEFLDRIERVLAGLPPRQAYYPGALARYERFTGCAADRHDGTLPWRLLRDVDPERAPQLFDEESFVCVAAETARPAADAREFVDQVADFVNRRCWGTLGAGVMVHPSCRKQPGDRARFERLIDRLRYGTVAINHWPGLAFGMMSCPWGGYPGATLADPQSGIGWVHNVLMFEAIEKTVLEGPLVVYPKPLWFPTHRGARRLAERVLALCERPGWWRLPGVFAAALRT